MERSVEQYGKAAIVHLANTGKRCIAIEMTIGEVVVRGILTAPKYVTTVYQDQKTLAKYQAHLDSIGMVWGNRNERQWNEGYQEAKRYFDAHGDLNVPADYVSPVGYNLGNWVKRQRYTCQNPEKSCAVLTEERIAKLDEIGMRWEKADSKPRRLELAQESKRKSENLNVSAKHKTGEDIGLCS